MHSLLNRDFLVSLEPYSLQCLTAAMVIYALAFIFYVVDLANRAEIAETPRATATPQASGAKSAATARQITKFGRIGFSLTVIATLLHLAATVLRGIGAERVPWANMYEFALTATLASALVFLVTQFFVELRYLGALVTGLILVFLGITRVNYYVPISPLQPALDSYWLVIHIIVAVLAVGFLTLSFGFSVLQLLQIWREKKVKNSVPKFTRVLETIPGADKLDNFAYRVAIIGFVFWTFTLIAGAIWAEAAWSRYWGWDVKEVWTFVIWVLYAGFIHAHATRGWRGVRSAWLSIISYGAVIFNFAVVNVYFKGLHAYSGL